MQGYPPTSKPLLTPNEGLIRIALFLKEEQGLLLYFTSPVMHASPCYPYFLVINPTHARLTMYVLLGGSMRCISLIRRIINTYFIFSLPNKSKIIQK